MKSNGKGSKRKTAKQRSSVVHAMFKHRGVNVLSFNVKLESQRTFDELFKWDAEAIGSDVEAVGPVMLYRESGRRGDITVVYDPKPVVV